MKARTPIFAAVLTVVAVLAGAAFAVAAPGNGATKTNQEFCNTTAFGTVCSDLNFVVNTTTTPSGNVSYVTSGKNTILNNTNSGCTFTGPTEFQDHYLLKDGVFAERGSHEESYLIQQCGTLQQKCTFTRQAHLVDGTFQYNLTNFVCEPL
jgi:hypothetical protein